MADCDLAPSKLAYSIREACAALSLGRTKLYALIAEGELEAVRIGGRTVIPAGSMIELLARATRVAAPGRQN